MHWQIVGRISWTSRMSSGFWMSGSSWLITSSGISTGMRTFLPCNALNLCRMRGIADELDAAHIQRCVDSLRDWHHDSISGIPLLRASQDFSEERVFLSSESLRTTSFSPSTKELRESPSLLSLSPSSSSLGSSLSTSLCFQAQAYSRRWRDSPLRGVFCP